MRFTLEQRFDAEPERVMSAYTDPALYPMLTGLSKVATPQMVLNYAAYLEERAYFEDSFRAFERGLAAFPWPHVRPIWLTYLRKFVARYGAGKLERCRDLFEQAVDGCPPADALLVYSLYADFEERFGSVRHAMGVLDRATKAVDAEHLYEAFLSYIRKAEEFFGAPRTVA